MNVVDKINAEGSAAGVPPDVTQRISPSPSTKV
jgi:hypothetical protein